MNEKNRLKRQELRIMKTLAEYENLRDNLKLTLEQKKIMDMVYLQGWDLRTIAETMNFSERTAKRRVKEILDLL